MMFDLADIRPLTDFLRNHKEHVKRLRAARRPEVLTINGKAELVIQDAASYQRLVDTVDRAEAIVGIQRGLEAMDRGRGRPMRDFLEELRKKSGRRG
jgi:PHD/YefM family antitoxin component YafN of YafNO toxin-antitoxin module